ncbi:MAG: hypothetical protein CMH49_08475, partial [Myxococcales bacterium]|nr:hypothetical protein [Myxococcales bacterium]
MLSLKTSVSSQNSRRNLFKNGRVINKSLERLSSGKRVNGASDDAAGLSIATRMTAQIKESTQLLKNVNDTASLAQTASSLLREQINGLQRMRELTVQAMSETQQSNDRQSIEDEIVQLKEEVSNISEGTFNDQRIFGNQFNFQLDGVEGLGDLQVNTQKTSADRLGRHSLRSSQVGVNQTALDEGDITLSTLDGGTISLRASQESDDLISTSNRASSAISKAKVINGYTEQTGVEALIEHTEFIGGIQIGAVTLDPTNYFTLNGVGISGFSVVTGDADGVLVDAINAVSEETGIIASTTTDGELRLIAEDGRNIEIEAFGNASQLGIGQSVTSARLTLRCCEAYSVNYADITVDEKLGLMFDARIPLFPGTASNALAGADAGAQGWAFLGDPSNTNYNFNDNVTLSGRYNGDNVVGGHNFDLEIDLTNSGLYFGILDNDPDGNGNYTPSSYYNIQDQDIVTSGSGTYYFGTTVALNELSNLGIVNDQANRIFTNAARPLPASYGDSYFQFTIVNANTVDAYDVGQNHPDPNNTDADGVDAIRFVAPIGSLNQLSHMVGVDLGNQVETLSVKDKASADRALFTIDTAIAELTQAESTYGAILNRLESTGRSLEQ